jgi:tRNA modification GTPase
MFSSIFSKDLTLEKERGVHLGTIRDGDDIIDQAVVIQYLDPKSFTGEDLLEIIIHGSPLIAYQLIETLIAKGARNANPGEFSSRAFLHQKVDLIQAEAIHDVIQATTIEAKRLSLLSLTGQTSEKIAPIRQRLADILSLIEVNIDYPEYQDIEQATKEAAFEEVSEGLAQTQVEKLKTLAEGIDYSDADGYRKKLEIVKEQYFKTAKTASSTGLITEEIDGEDDTANGTTGYTAPGMDKYVQAIAKAVK